MITIIAPINPGTQGEIVFNLQEILQSFVDLKIIKIDGWDNMASDFKAEKEKQFYGKITAILVTQFRIQHSLTSGPDVDEPTAKAINSLLELPSDKRIIKGTVLFAAKKPVQNILVKAFKKSMRLSDPIGEVYTNTEGKYEIPGNSTGEEEANALVVVAYDKDGLEIARSNGTGIADIDIILPGTTLRLSEYDSMVLELESLMKALSFEELTEKDIEFLGENSRFPKEHIVLLRLAFVTASKFLIKPDIGFSVTDHKNFRIPVAVFYACFRQGLPTEPRLLFGRSEELAQTLATAIKSGIIAEIEKDSIEKIKEEFVRLNLEMLLTPALDATPSLGDVLNTIPVKLPYEKQVTVANVLQDKTNPQTPLKEKLKNSGLEDDQIKAVETTLAFQSFSENFLPLIKTLQNDTEINSLRDLALNLSRQNFIKKIIDNNASPENEKPEDFAGRLYNNLFNTEPTAVLRNMLEDDSTTPVTDSDTRTGVSRFFANLPDTFNIKTTSVFEAFKNKNAFDGIAPEVREKVEKEIKSLHRISVLSPVPEAVPVLMRANVTSAMMMSDMPEDQFIQTFSGQLGENGESVSRQLHVNAVNTRIRNEQVLISLMEVKQGTGIAMVDKAMRNGFDESGEFENTLTENNLSWDSLFGDSDFCECGECTSVYSASAYFVELLQYLRNNNLDPAATRVDPKDITGTPLQKLFDRRPDLQCLQLTCKNTNTILPYVDLVNEVMESYVDVQETLPFNVGEDETSGELLSQPQHTADGAYKKLQDAVYPFALPYHQPIDAARIYLNSLDTSRYELTNTFCSARDTVNLLEPMNSIEPSGILLSTQQQGLDDFYKGYLDKTADAEYLNLTQEEYIILTHEAFVSNEYWSQQRLENGRMITHSTDEYVTRIKVREVHEYFGYTLEAEMLSEDESIKKGLTFVKAQFLKRTGVLYTDLVELLKTQCLNPEIFKQQGLSMLDGIPFSYGFLTALVKQNAATLEEKYSFLINFLSLVTATETLAVINQDPCSVIPIAEATPVTGGNSTTFVNLSKRRLIKNLGDVERDTNVTPTWDVRKWVYENFENIGKVIVLDSGDKCIDGQLGIISDNDNADLLRAGYIQACRIFGDEGEVIGSIDKNTGRITMEPGQPDKDWSNLLFIGEKEEGTFVKVLESYYLVRLTPKAETCNIDTVRLIHLDGTALELNEYDHIHRFIRLKQKLGWTINETDNALVSLSQMGGFEISPQLLHQLVAVKKLHEKTGLELIKLLTFWTSISTIGEQSLYKRLFLTHNLKGVDNVFNADTNGRYLADSTQKISAHIPVLMAALNLKADDIEAVIKSKEAILTIDNVSTLYRYRLLSKILGLQVTDFVTVLPLFKDPFSNAEATLLFLEQWGRIEEAGFDHHQLNYILQGKDDNKKAIGPTSKTLLQLAKTLYDGLNAISEAHQDLKANIETTLPEERESERRTLATAELIKEKATLLYDQTAVEKIIGLLEGTTVYSAEGPKDIKDGLRPIPLQAPATMQDYEYLQLTNYPLLNKKIEYDKTKGSLQITGVLTEIEIEEDASLFLSDNFRDIPGLVSKLSGSDLLSKYLWSRFPASAQTELTNGTLTLAMQKDVLARELNSLITSSTLIYDASHFKVTLSPETKILRDKTSALSTDERKLLNRMLFEDAYPVEVVYNQQPAFLPDDFLDFSALFKKLTSTNQSPVSSYLWSNFSVTSQGILNDLVPDTEKQLEIIIQKFNELITGSISIASHFVGVNFSVVTKALLDKSPVGDELIALNRLLLEDAYPEEIITRSIGFKTILDNLRPDSNHPALSLNVSFASIRNQQGKVFNEVFNGDYNSSKTDFLKTGDINDLPDDQFERNTAPLKRLKFLEAFLPYLRKELTHRFIVDTLSAQTGLDKDTTDILINRILNAGTAGESIYTLFEQINKAVYPDYKRWEGDVISTEGSYTFIVKDTYAHPALRIDGQSITFVAQSSPYDEWRSAEQKLTAGIHKLRLNKAKPENLYWKTVSSSITPVPSTLLLSGWDGYIIPLVEAEYTFIVKGSSAIPVIEIDGLPVQFSPQPGSQDEWKSPDLKLLVGKGYKLTLTAINLDNLYWKTEKSPLTSIPPSALMSGWEGYLIPSAEGQYTFIIKNKEAPDLSLDGVAVTFTQQPGFPGEWWSEPQKLQSGKLKKMSLPEVNIESLYWKTATSSITSIPSASLLSGYAEHNTIKAFTQLQKTALLVNGFKISAEEIEYLSGYPLDAENVNFNEVGLKDFLRLESYTRLRNTLPVGKINILEFFRWIYSSDASAVKLGEKIADLTGWKKESIEQLISKDHFDLLQPEAFHNEINLLKLQKAIAVAGKIHMDIGLLFDWAKPNSDFRSCRNIANSIQHSIRALYNQEDWEKVVKPLSDKLRENQKNALIAYLLVEKNVKRWGVTDADGLFEFFLIDVQMDACMETSRIKQAISSVQLFIQRCFLGLESQLTNGIETGVPGKLLDRKRWDWMQRYRVWEANRKVFLYPENWIECNLRDDKSSFFKELESELLQKDINKQNVEDALKAYLYKVGEVADMEVVAVCLDEKKKLLHVFSRTRNAPYFFYYRYLDLTSDNWYPWEKMQVDIPSYDREEVTEFLDKTGNTPFQLNPDYKNLIGNGCYLTPVIWNGRLLIFFPQFMRMTRSDNDLANPKSVRDMAEDSADSSKPIEYWQIKMAFSEYRSSKWTQKQLSKGQLNDIPTNTLEIAKFRNAFSDDRKAKANVEVAAKASADAFEKLKRAWVKLIAETSSTYFDQEVIIKAVSPGNPVLIIDSIFSGVAKNVSDDKEAGFKRVLNSSHPYLMAIVNWQDANSAATQANTDAAKAAVNLSKLMLPPEGSDIARYEFVQIASPLHDLFKVQVYYGATSIGAFEFNGSDIITPPGKTYPAGDFSFGMDRFHHYAPSYLFPSAITSLQLINSANSHVFDDKTATTYTFYFGNYIEDRITVPFHHADAHKLLGVTNEQQSEAFFKFPYNSLDRNPDKDDVFGGYDHDQVLETPNSYHELKRPYSIYNWELFFHTPMMLADSLSKSQQFEDAMKWYHYVFNPIGDKEKNNPLWQFVPFQDMNVKNILNSIFNKLKPNQADKDISEWRSNPFKPHLVARSRPVAYMKWVVMKYVDNLVAWGDYLFRQDTIESINQATQLYILAVHILGPRPQIIPKRGKIKPHTYLSLLDKWDAFGNAMVEMEMTGPFSNQTPLPIGVSNGVTGLANVFGFASSTYFCIPNNPKLMGYWDTISDRLFKIRHCENIEGIFRQLPLFEPPIDPALLVKAAAEGLSISSVLNDLNTPMPNYRFYYLLQKALELCGELKSMGGAMLSAIEKKDNETISLIRAKHETSMLNLVMDIKLQQLEEAQKSLEGLQQNRKSPEHRMKYYLQLIGEDGGKVPGLDSDFSEIANEIEVPVGESGLKLIKHEKEDMDKANLSADLQLAAGVTETLAGILYAIPMIKADVAPMGIGAGLSFGGTNLGQLTQAISKVVQLSATHLSHQSASAAKKGSHLRALQDRVMQANAAGYEIKQIDKQILSQQIRIGIANMEITNHQKQINNSQEIEEFLKNKYSNEELYSWMKGSLSTLYHQVYSLAFELSKKAEKVFCFERGLTNSNFIKAGYWDAGYNGLLAGEQLYVGLKQLEAAHQENRGYDYEITKHVSLKQIDPMAILQLRQTGKCEFALPEVLFDMDYPGHFKRRIKSVSISVPCIAGPYTSLNGTLRLLENKFRNSALAKNAAEYQEKTEETDDRFNSFIIPISAIAASSGQNDSGMFELNFKDERYLPFEGAGVISKWRFELPVIRQFDYNTTADIIIHVRYTSTEGGERLKSAAHGGVLDYLREVTEISKEGLFSLIDIKHDMSNEWYALKSGTGIPVKFSIDHSRLPFFTKYFADAKIENVSFIAKFKKMIPPSFKFSISGQLLQFAKIGFNMNEKFQYYIGETDDIQLNALFEVLLEGGDLVEELMMIVKYNLKE